METWKHIVQVLVVVTVSVLGTAPYFAIADGIKKRPLIRCIIVFITYFSMSMYIYLVRDGVL